LCYLLTQFFWYGYLFEYHSVCAPGLF